MTTPALKIWQDLPEGVTWPGPDTLVLLNRDLRPDTDPTDLSRFRADQWNLNPAIFEDHYSSITVNFGLIPAQLRQTAKFYTWQLLNHQGARGVSRMNGGVRRSAVLTIAGIVAKGLQPVFSWFADQGVTELSQVTGLMLDDYLESLKDETVPLDAAYRRITEIRRLWVNRDILPSSMRLPDAPLWGGEDTRDLLGRTVSARENRTPRIGEVTMQMLLHWAIRFTEDFADDIIAAQAEHDHLHSRTLEGRQGTSTQAAHRHRPGELAEKVTAYLADLRERGECLPGIRRPDGQLEIRWRRLAAILGCNTSIAGTATGRLVRQSGLPLSEEAYLSTSVTGLLDGELWRSGPIRYEEAPVLARLLSTACFVIISYLSGARPGEVLNLQRNCITHDAATDMWLMEGLYFKGAEDEDGNKIPAGQIRPDPWVVIELVARAVAVLERLHDHPLLFPGRIEAHRKRKKGVKRLGNARSDSAMNDDLEAFVTWVNDEYGHRGRTDLIPDDGRGPLTARRFRRTLAWFIRRRPRGLIAASIQYGHAHTRMIQGYAGTYESGFPDEYAFEDWLYRIEAVAEDEQALSRGEHVSGPAAGAYRFRVNAASREFSGRVLTRERQARDLLGNPLLQIHHGQGMTCVFDPSTAACQIRGTADDPLVTPDTDDCRPRCPNLARTDRDIEHIRHHAAELAEIVADPLAPPIRHAREQRELARLEQIMATHEEVATR